MFRLIHPADWQLGKPFGRFPADVRSALAEARFDAIDALGRLAGERGIGHVLVAGDVFDNTGPSDRELVQALARVARAPCHWWLLPGNHDHARPGGLWDRVRAKAPETMHVLDSAEAVEMENGAWVLPAPLEHRRTRADPTEAFGTMATPPGALRISLAHGSVVDFAQKGEADNPIPPDRAIRSDLDYLALGDWHGHLLVGERTAYSGTPERDRFGHDEPGSVIVAEVGSGAAPVLERVKTGRYRWLDRAWSIDGPEALDAEWRALMEALDPAATLLDLTLDGVVSLPDRVAILARVADEIEHALRWSSVDANGLAVTPNADDLADLLDRGTVGAAARRLLEASQGDGADAALAGRALERLYVEATRVGELA